MGSYFRNNGFTLVESLVALTVLCVGFLAVAGVTLGTMRGRSFSARVSRATVLAQEKMEDVVREGYSGLPTTDSSSSEAYGSIAGYPRYSRVVSVDVADPAPGMKTVTVMIRWDFDRHAVRLKTIIAK